jgi:hypothetical protein
LKGSAASLPPGIVLGAGLGRRQIRVTSGKGAGRFRHDAEPLVPVEKPDGDFSPLPTSMPSTYVSMERLTVHRSFVDHDLVF